MTSNPQQPGDSPRFFESTPLTQLANEIGNTYVRQNDRSIVSLIVGYGPHDDITTAEEAAAAALDLTRDEGARGTHWWIHDRQTRRTFMLEQSEFEAPPSYP